MEWLSIERIGLELHLLAGTALWTGEPVQRRSRDIAHWCKMFRMTDSYHWKACVFFDDQFYIDV